MRLPLFMQDEGKGDFVSIQFASAAILSAVIEKGRHTPTTKKHYCKEVTKKKARQLLPY